MTDKKKGLTPKEQDYEAMVADIQPTFQSQEPQQVVCPDCGGCGGVDVEIDGEIESVGCALCGATGKVHPETHDELLTDEESFNLGFKTSYKAESTELFAYSEGVQDGAKAQLLKCHQSEAARIKELEIEVVELLRTKAEMFIEKEEADEWLSKANARIKELNTQVKALNELCNRQQKNFLKTESELKQWQKFYVADVKPSTTEAAIRADQNKKIGDWLNKNVTVTPNICSIDRLEEAIAKLQKGEF